MEFPVLGLQEMILKTEKLIHCCLENKFELAKVCSVAESNCY